MGIFNCGIFSTQLGGNAKINYFHLIGRGVDDNITGINIFVNNVATVNFANNLGNLNGDRQEFK